MCRFGQTLNTKIQVCTWVTLCFHPKFLHLFNTGRILYSLETEQNSQNPATTLAEDNSEEKRAIFPSCE